MMNEHQRHGGRRFGIGRWAGFGVITVMAAASAAGAGPLPTGTMLSPHPSGPEAVDLPAATAIDPYRVPSAWAYGLADRGDLTFSAPGSPAYRGEAGHIQLVLGEHDTAGVVPVCRAFVAVCPVTLRDARKIVRPNPRFSSTFEGKRYRFSSAEAKARFDAHPARYAPAAQGMDVVLAAMGAEHCLGSLKQARYYENRLYLFKSEKSAELFVKNPQAYVGGDEPEPSGEGDDVKQLGDANNEVQQSSGDGGKSEQLASGDAEPEQSGGPLLPKLQ